MTHCMWNALTIDFWFVYFFRDFLYHFSYYSFESRYRTLTQKKKNLKIDVQLNDFWILRVIEVRRVNSSFIDIIMNLHFLCFKKLYFQAYHPQFFWNVFSIVNRKKKIFLFKLLDNVVKCLTTSFRGHFYFPYPI